MLHFWCTLESREIVLSYKTSRPPLMKPTHPPI